jgi:hypothetical protein
MKALGGTNIFTFTQNIGTMHAGEKCRFFSIPVSPNMLAVAQAAAEQAETENEQGHL